MTPGAQIAATIELLESVESAWDEGRNAPADGLLGDYFRKRRYIGSKDKAAISTLFYTCLRHGASLQWWVEHYKLPVCPRSLVLTALVVEQGFSLEGLKTRFTNEGYDPSRLNDQERAFVEIARTTTPATMAKWMRLNVPEWVLPKLEAQFGDETEAQAKALNQEAPLDLRVNTLKSTREDAQAKLAEEGYEAEPTPFSPIGLRLPKRGAVFATKTFKSGAIEVQDEGSQLVALLTDAKPGQKVIDFCAGAGGKTLALAAQMQNKGRILAWDTSEKRLSQMPKRLKRAGVDNTQIHTLSSENDSFIKRHKASADRVLIDAPCSGSGTWRRNPDLKWRFTPNDFKEITAVQQAVLDSAQRLVKPGGRLIYITCSLFAEENQQQVETFLKSHVDFRVVSPAKIWDNDTPIELEGSVQYLQLTPYEHGTDGFFAAILEKSAN